MFFRSRRLDRSENTRSRLSNAQLQKNAAPKTDWLTRSAPIAVNSLLILRPNITYSAPQRKRYSDPCQSRELRIGSTRSASRLRILLRQRGTRIGFQFFSHRSANDLSIK